ncbi:MAG: peptidoglycan-binding domain-containing protein [Minisyncoccia bacterium]
MPKKIFNWKIIFIIAALFVFLSPAVFAQSINSQSVFYVESDYDYYSRNQLNATLVYQTNKLNFFVDTNWWQSLSFNNQNTISAKFATLATYFEQYDYPRIVATFGSEALPGYDNDYHIYVLIHPLKENYVGYARFVDSLPAASGNFSNQHEMVYLSTSIFWDASINQLGYYLSHEVLHLISFNQKGIFVNSDDERWLAEARSDYLSTFLGYNTNLSGSFLEKHLNDLRQNPSFSLLEFRGTNSDYAAVHLLAEYIVEKYGIKILVDSLRSNLTGIASINYALAKNGYSEDFNTIFKNWLITLLFNDCSLGKLYCFDNANLKNFHIYPYTTYLPEYGVVSLTASTYLNLYAGNWIKISGGRGDLKIYYEFPQDTQFILVYITTDKSNNKKIETVSSENKKGTISINDFGVDTNTLYLLPIITDSSSGGVLFKYDAQISSSASNNSALIEQLTQRIAQLKAQLSTLIAQLNAMNQTNLSCSFFQRDLYYGLRNDNEVKCLQKMLSEKEPDLYSERLITGNFLDLTKAAIQKFQQKNGLPATGYFGPLTRAIANRQWFGY